jgi:hypothetical protein
MAMPFEGHLGKSGLISNRSRFSDTIRALETLAAQRGSTAELIALPP